MERLTHNDHGQFCGSWSSDGRKLTLLEFHPETNHWQIYLYDASNQQVTPYLETQADEWYPEISPDGNWMAYVSLSDNQIYVESVPAGGGKWPIGRGTEPLWSRDGTKLYYRRILRLLTNQVWRVNFQTESGFTNIDKQLVFSKPGYGSGWPLRTWDISPDGTRFLMVKMGEIDPQPLTEMVFVRNWVEEVKRHAP